MLRLDPSCSGSYNREKPVVESFCFALEGLRFPTFFDTISVLTGRSMRVFPDRLGGGQHDGVERTGPKRHRTGASLLLCTRVPWSSNTTVFIGSSCRSRGSG